MVYDTAIKMSNAMASPITYENISTPKAMLTTIRANIVFTMCLVLV